VTWPAQACCPTPWSTHPVWSRFAPIAGEKSPVEVSADILATLRYRAEDTFNDDIFGAVITVPAYFDDAQRQATKDAAQLAGINVLRLHQRAHGGGDCLRLGQRV